MCSAALVIASCASDDEASSMSASSASSATRGTSVVTTTRQASTASTSSTSSTSPAPAVVGSTPVAANPGSVPVAPSGDDFYQPPTPIPGSANGDLIWAAALPGAVDGATSWRVLYRSENLQGQPIAVSGLVVLPVTPSAGAPVLTWAHGTTGLGDQCAISRQFTGGFSAEKLLAPFAIGRGWAFVATDYEGLGTPGVHPYLVGLSEARGVLDIVRAAAQVTDTVVTPASPVMVLGHSQGGGAALFAAEQAATYAPELQIVGTAAGAPAGDLELIAAGSWSETTVNPFGAELIAGFSAAYPDLPLDAVADAAGQQVLDEVGTQCSDQTVALGLTPADVGAVDPTQNEAWAAVIDANTAGQVAPSAPVMIFHGEADTTVPRLLTDRTLADYCEVGATVEVKSYPGADHTSVILAALNDIVGFFEARLAGHPPISSC